MFEYLSQMSELNLIQNGGLEVSSPENDSSKIKHQNIPDIQLLKGSRALKTRCVPSATYFLICESKEVKFPYYILNFDM